MEVDLGMRVAGCAGTGHLGGGLNITHPIGYVVLGVECPLWWPNEILLFVCFLAAVGSSGRRRLCSRVATAVFLLISCIFSLCLHRHSLRFVSYALPYDGQPGISSSVLHSCGLLSGYQL